jgi:hypothetical protein
MDAKQRERLRKRKQEQKKKDREKAAARRREAMRVASASPAFVENRRFNRRETAFGHYYYDNFGWAPREEHTHTGWIKCRLLHGHGYSLIVPDQLFVDFGGLRWIQPLAFSAVLLTRLDEHQVVCDLGVDISCGQTLLVRFFSNDIVQSFLDGSQLFRCKISGPAAIHEYATGDAEWGPGDTPRLRLFHHTTADSRDKIAASGHFRTGPYNIQGTTKRLQNVAYAYFTPLDRISTDGDLRRIAMSPSGIIELRRDGFTPPLVRMPGWEETYKADILRLPVYPCDPSKREAGLEVWIDSTTLAPQHIYRHDEGGPVYYELPHAFIQRVGTEPNQHIVFDDRKRIARQAGLKPFEYVVVGDCTTLAGLIAPYDEEDTTHIMKIERIPAGQTMLDFWFQFANQDLFSAKHVELQEFEPNKAGS